MGRTALETDVHEVRPTARDLRAVGGNILRGNTVRVREDCLIAV